MQFLKSKEQIISKLLSYPTPWKVPLIGKSYRPFKVYEEQLNYQLKSFFNNENENYQCGSGKEFKLSSASLICIFFKKPDYPKTYGSVKRPIGWSRSNYEDYDNWIIHYFIRSREQPDYCNLLEIRFNGGRIRSNEPDLLNTNYTEWHLNNRRPHIKTLWTCKYKTACEINQGISILGEEYELVKTMKRHNLFTKINEIFSSWNAFLDFFFLVPLFYVLGCFFYFGISFYAINFYGISIFWNLVIQLFLIYPLFVEYFHRRFPKLYIDLKKNLSKFLYFHRRFPKLYIDLKKNLSKFFLVFPADKNFKRYLHSIKNKDWDYVKYRTIIFTGSWLIAITIIVLIVVLFYWWY